MKPRSWRYAVLLSATFLTACGGGGGGGSPAPVPPPPPPVEPSPPPAPTPPPPAPPENFDTAEYRRNWGLAHIEPIPAYRNGATGRGVTVGVVDSGIDLNSPEFSGRIHSASRDVAGTRTLQDEDGHGTWVATVIGAARNGTATHGVAYESTLLIARADEPGTCAANDCSFYDDDIAAGVDLSRTAGARVVNISLGGSEASIRLNNAVDRATAAGTVIVISAGNDGAANPDAMAQVATSAQARGLVLVAGAVDERNTISSFSNRAGSAQDFYVVAPGERILTTDVGGASVYVSGTSIAAPHVSGAIALLASAFPNMTGRELVDLIFRTATDLGAPGVDPVYGRGLINIGRAFQPQGQTALAGSAQPVDLAGANISLGSAFGDGGELSAALSNAVVLDMYNRAFTVNLSPTVRSSGVGLGLVRRLAFENSRNGGVLRGQKAALSFAGNTFADATVWNRLGMADAQLALARQPEADGWLSFTPAKNTHLAFGYGRSATDLLGAVAGERRESVSFLSYGGRVGETFGIAAEQPISAAVSLPVGRWQWSMAASRTALERDDRTSPLLTEGEAHISAMQAKLHRQVRWGEFGLSFGWIEESGSVLGARSTGAFGLKAGARTATAGLGATLDLGPRWSLSADAAAGHTRLDNAENALLAPVGGIWTSSWRFSLTGEGLWQPGDTFGFMVAQPLRVERALAHVTLPVAYSYDAGVTEHRSARANLAPTGREIDLEAVYAVPLGEGANMAVHGFHRFDAGHGAAGRDDSGFILRLTMRR